MIMIILADVDNDFSHDSVNMYFPTQFTADKGQIYVWKAFGYTPFFTLNSKYTCLKENLEYEFLELLSVFDKKKYFIEL